MGVRGRNRSVMGGVALGLLLVASLRPSPWVDRALGPVFVPSRFAVELLAPGLLARTHAGEGLIPSTREAMLADAEAFDAALRRASLPTDGALPSGVEAREAEVLARPETKDRLEVFLADPRGVRRGDPVVFGNAFVGRVHEVASVDARGREAHLATVELLTQPEVRLCGEVLGTEARSLVRPDEARSALGPLGELRRPPVARMVLGGVMVGQRGDLRWIAVRTPWSTVPWIELQDVPIYLDDDEPQLRRARGFLLGRLRVDMEAEEGGAALHEPVQGIVPAVDFLSGLTRLHVLVEAGASEGELAPTWTQESLTVPRALRLDPSAPLVLRAGWSAGLRPGAAVAAQGSYLGRLRNVGAAHSVVEALDTPGASVLAAALSKQGREVQVLGRLVSRGVQGGMLHLAGDPGTPPPAGGSALTLRTISGEALTPSGLLLGDGRVELQGSGSWEVLLEWAAPVEPPAQLDTWIEGEARP